MATKIITVEATPPSESTGADYYKGAPLNAAEFDQNLVNLRAAVDRKASLSNPTFTGTVVLPATTSIGDVSATELQYLNSVTSNVQDQINAKAPINNPTFTGTVSLSTGTANGVLYLNGSKQVTSGSALTFDGTNLTTTGYLISSRQYPLIKAVCTDSGGAVSALQSDATNGYVGTTNNKPFCITINNSNVATFDSSGNLGLGVTPSAWGSDFKTIELANGMFVGNFPATTTAFVGLNAYYNSGWKYKNSNYASYYEQYSGQHQWYTAPSGTAGNAITFTQAMTLDASGNLLVGLTSITGYRFAVQGGDARVVHSGWTMGGTYSPQSGDVGIGREVLGGMIFATNGTERARIDSSGNLSVGTAGFDSRIYCAGVYNITGGSAANMVVGSDGGFYRSTSALKYKTDIRDLESIDINTFRPVRYKSKCEIDDPTVDHFGIIADEVDSAGIKELVTYGADGAVEGFQYERLTVVLVKAIQELSAQNKELTAALQEAVAKIESLTQRIEALEAKGE